MTEHANAATDRPKEHLRYSILTACSKSNVSSSALARPFISAGGVEPVVAPTKSNLLETPIKQFLPREAFDHDWQEYNLVICFPEA